MVEIGEGFKMRSMNSREIHHAIRTALSEVPKALASGELDGSGRYYSDSELRERFSDLRARRKRQIKRDHKSKPPRQEAKSA